MVKAFSALNGALTQRILGKRNEPRNPFLVLTLICAVLIGLESARRLERLWFTTRSVMRSRGVKPKMPIVVIVGW